MYKKNLYTGLHVAKNYDQWRLVEFEVRVISMGPTSYFRFWICFNSSQNFFLNVSSPYKTIPSIISSSSSKSTTKTSYDCVFKNKQLCVYFMSNTTFYRTNNQKQTSKVVLYFTSNRLVTLSTDLENVVPRKTGLKFFLLAGWQRAPRDGVQRSLWRSRKIGAYSRTDFKLWN
ncbi:hypothetical protein NQ318_007898 [Aromia moschata]|uniref:Uncharacterized protein n=1 Tax=Aromia moschata TaxID=1265417 RepID=A0AAV8XV33_9CUCU|nr:hypothetical protein NQ318_007898 [Aromia moschata]